MAACRYYGCVYIADSLSSSVHRVDVSNGCDSSRRHVRWSSDISPTGLSITPQNNVLVAYQCSPFLREFSTHGELLREVTLQMEVVGPVHALQLTAEHYVVCIALPDNQAAICHLDGNGNVVSMHSGCKKWFYSRQTDQYVHLAADGIVLAADARNGRILMMDPKLRGEPRELINGLNGLSRFAFDAESSRLYVVSNCNRIDGSEMFAYSLV